MAFDHRILDAKGAEAFLRLFQDYSENTSLEQVFLTSQAHLDNWTQKFLAGKQTNRFLLTWLKAAYGHCLLTR